MDAPRELWMLAEPYHAVVYFSSEARTAFETAGLRGFWRGYFAGRAAPLGPVGPGLVTALFFGFHLDFVGRALPGVWTMATPSATLEARLSGVDDALRQVGVADQAAECREAGELLRAALDGCSPAGRPMYAANAELEWPAEPHLLLWHATTLLREHRGDGHVAALAAEGVGACEAHVVRIAADGHDPDTIRPHRGWSEQEWALATDRLRTAGWIDASGSLTRLGRGRRDAIERRTDELASGPIERIGDRLDHLVRLLEGIAGTVISSGTVPYPNAMGVPRPDARGPDSGARP